MRSELPTATFTSTAIVHRRSPRDPQVAQALLDYLVQRGTLDRMAAERAAQAQIGTGERIDVVILQLGLVTERTLVEAIAEFSGLALASPEIFPLSPLFPEELSADFVRRSRIVPVEEHEDYIGLVTADAFAHESLAAVSFLFNREVRVLLGMEKDVVAAIDRLYGELQRSESEAIDAEGSGTGQDDDVQRLRDMASEAPIIRLVNNLIVEAVQRRASDIHIEPMADSLRVRYRVDGILEEVSRLAPELQAGIASRIKILGRLNIAERRLPQDGRTKFVVAGREIDLRISTTPLMYGESIVMRILDRDSVELDFAALGFSNEARAKLMSLIGAPNGIVLVTGPTGSGKTTTLYAALRILNSIERKVFSVEDPIEYQLPGVNQMQIRPAIGLDFLHCLRSILRQDPDVVMVGEMRDVETVRTGIQASLTGHLVLSTLHTNSAAASITRLLQMGAEDYLLASTVTGVLAQRLVRRLCPHCATPDPRINEELGVLGAELQAFAQALEEKTPLRPSGCPKCRSTGFSGRTTISEILLVDVSLRSKIQRGIADREIEQTARAGGMETMMQDGLRKVMSGQTTLAEVLRVTRM
jgi:general secretion pathway protein E